MMPVPMVGRADELGELTSAWSRLYEGGGTHSRTAVITGTGGAGKSLLVSAALESFEPRPDLVLAGQARVHTPAPYDWLAAALSGRDTRELSVPADALAWLAQHPDAPRYRYAPDALLRLAVRTVRALVGGGPAVLVVEDLHALDPASLNLVAELSSVPGLPVLMLVTSRPPEAAVSPALAARTLARLAGVPAAIRQHLGALGAGDVAELLARVYGQAADVPAHVAQAVCERTGGNPYWLTELLAAGRGAAPEALAYGPLPEHLRFMPGAAPAQYVTGKARSATGKARSATGKARSATGKQADTGLTARELEVLSCLAAGMSNKQVAHSLGISIRTVTVHVSNLLRKTRSASRTEAALWAVRRQLTG